MAEEQALHIARSLRTNRKLEIENWIVHYLAEELKLTKEEVDTDVPFENLGVDSMIAAQLTADLEVWLGRATDPTLPYDFPTIASLSAELASSGGAG